MKTRADVDPLVRQFRLDLIKLITDYFSAITNAEDSKVDVKLLDPLILVLIERLAVTAQAARIADVKDVLSTIEEVWDICAKNKDKVYGSVAPIPVKSLKLSN